jgi:hypothetical protein
MLQVAVIGVSEVFRVERPELGYRAERFVSLSSVPIPIVGIDQIAALAPVLIVVMIIH